MDEQTLSECELVVMRVIWASEEALCLQDIVERIHTVYHKDWKQQTISVFLNRITKKGFLLSRRQGRTFYYTPVIAEEDYEKREIAKCVDLWSGGRVDTFLAALASARDLTEVEKKELRKFVDELDAMDRMD
jgi:predicted transcriptional regulator